MPNLKTVKIVPAIGIARIGNSPEWYLGPELPFPATPPAPPDGQYKDFECRIRRQAQRFRLWGFFDDNSDRELTLADGTIQWTVHLANAKAVNYGEPGGLIDPGPRTLNGANDSASFANGTYTYEGEVVEVPLGDAFTDADGRLIVAGGFGFSSTPIDNNPLGYFLNTPGWHDDVADGPINATIVVGGQTFNALGAWVICPPPRYAPTTYSPISLYDTLREVAIEKGLLGVAGATVVYRRHLADSHARHRDVARCRSDVRPRRPRHAFDGHSSWRGTGHRPRKHFCAAQETRRQRRRHAASLRRRRRPSCAAPIPVRSDAKLECGDVHQRLAARCADYDYAGWSHASGAGKLCRRPLLPRH